MSLSGCSGSLLLCSISTGVRLRRSILGFLFLLSFLRRRILLLLLWHFFVFASLWSWRRLSFHTKTSLDIAKEFVDSGGSRRLGLIFCGLLCRWHFLIFLGFCGSLLLVFKNGQFSQFYIRFCVLFNSLLLVSEKLGHHFLVDSLFDPWWKLEERNLLFQSLLVQFIVLDLSDKVHMRAVNLDWLAS